MSNSLATVIASLYEFHRNGYNFASGTISAGGDFGEAIKEPTFSNILVTYCQQLLDSYHR